MTHRDDTARGGNQNVYFVLIFFTSYSFFQIIQTHFPLLFFPLALPFPLVPSAFKTPKFVVDVGH